MMRIKTIEEAHEALVAGEMSLEDFQAWLALWASKVLQEVIDEPLR